MDGLGQYLPVISLKKYGKVRHRPNTLKGSPVQRTHWRRTTVETPNGNVTEFTMIRRKVRKPICDEARKQSSGHTNRSGTTAGQHGKQLLMGGGDTRLLWSERVISIFPEYLKMIMTTC